MVSSCEQGRDVSERAPSLNQAGEDNIASSESRLTVPTKAMRGVTSIPILSLAKKEVLQEGEEGKAL